MTNISHYVIILVYLDKYIVIFFRGLFHGFFICIKKEVSMLGYLYYFSSKLSQKF